MDIIKLNSARNCFRYLIKALGIKEIYIPYYLCSCIRHIAFQEGCKVRFYHINKDFSPSILFPQDAYILYPNYFGICSNIVEFLAKQYPNLIVDNSHSFYSKYVGLASFNSLRKFFPQLRDGGFLYISRKISLDIGIDFYSYVPKVLNYDEICKNEMRIDNLDMKFISDTTYKLYEKIDLETEKIKRRKIFDNLSRIYEDTNILDINISNLDSPFCYPYLAKSEEEADRLVDNLKLHGMTIYRYWNKLPDSYPESIFYKRLVAIPIL